MLNRIGNYGWAEQKRSKLEGMSGMIDPSEFSNPDALLDHIIDSIVKPQLAETCDGDTDADWHSGVAWVLAAVNQSIQSTS